MSVLATLHTWDVAVCRRCNRASVAPACAKVFAVISRLGDGLIWYALMLALPIFYGIHDLGLSALMAGNGILCTALYRWLKGRTRRPRPCDVYSSLRLTVAPLDRFSFPSGHTLHAVAFTVIAGCFHPELAWALAAFTSLVALSRLVLGLHYPSDVIAGAVIGGGVSAGAVGMMMRCGWT